MAGAPSFGKMSTFIWRIATIDASATDMTATRIVIGRRMAVSTNHIDCAPASGYLVIWLSGHLVIWSFGYLVIWLSGYLVIWSFGYLVIFSRNGVRSLRACAAACNALNTPSRVPVS